MKTRLYFIFLFAALVLLSTMIFAQGVAVNEDNSDPDPSAALDVKSNDKGFLMPRMTSTEIASIVDPANGLIVYSTTDEKFYAYVSSENLWKEIAFVNPFTCGNSFTDERDGQTYNTVQIGTQCWMQENLNIGTMISGSLNQTDNGTIEKYCYDNNTANCDIYGGLYHWDEAMVYTISSGAQGICPSGWHIPTDVEYTDLTTFLGGLAVAGGEMKEAGTSHWAAPNIGASNSSGFTGLPSGYRHTDGNFLSITNIVGHWSSIENGSNAWRLALIASGEQSLWNDHTKTHAISVRCIKD